MDFLRRISFLIAFIGGGAMAASPADKTIEMAAVASIRNCDFSLSRRLSTALSANRPDLAVLYRLAWIQILSKTDASSALSETSSHESDDQSLAWQPSSEIWNDEWKSMQSRNRCSDSKGVFPAFVASERERELISKTLDPWKNDAPEILDNSLTTLRFNQWISQIPTETVETKRPLSCQRQAEALVKTEGVSEDQIKNWMTKCSACTGRFCAALKLQKADSLAGRGDWKRSFPLYVDVSHELGEIPAALSYRLTALGVLSNQPTEQLLRSITPLLVEESGEGIPKIQKEKLQASVCERLGAESAASLAKVFDKVFQRRERTKQIRQWILACEPAQAKHITRIASEGRSLKLSKDEQDLIRSTGILRETREKNRAKQGNSNTEISVGGVASKSKKLGGTLSIPVLFPFPPMTFPASAYDFRGDFLSAVDIKTREKR